MQELKNVFSAKNNTNPTRKEEIFARANVLIFQTEKIRSLLHTNQKERHESQKNGSANYAVRKSQGKEKGAIVVTIPKI